MSSIDQERLALIRQRPLGSGCHSSIEDGMCVMEATAYVAGETFSDHPSCVCPVISSFMRGWNDGLPSDAERDRLLKDLIPRIIGTKATEEIELKRSFMAIDWFVRVHTPAWLEMSEGLRPHASALRDLPLISSVGALVSAGEVLAAASAAASAAAWAAARAAAWDAAWAAAWAAARAAASAAARDAARAAASAAASAAARDAASAAASAAAWDALKPTVDRLQASALELVNRMIECK